MGSVLVVYALMQHPLRSTVSDHLYSFRRYSGARCFHVNLMLRAVPGWIAGAGHQLVIFHTILLSALRWGDESTAATLLARSRAASAAGDVKVALPQDEFLNSELLCRFIRDCEVDLVCSVAPPAEWPKIYAGVDREHVRFERVLTGYLDERTVRRIERIAAGTDRAVDVGYRAGAERPYLGRHGLLKTAIAGSGERAAATVGMSSDISLRPDDVLTGDDWFRALARWRWTLGVEGGASVLDSDGSVRAATERYVAAHPDATYAEIEAACFPGRDGELELFALSPRHLEACATMTGQILVEGEYDGVLAPGRHYLPISRDLSNMEAVLESARDEQRRRAMVVAAHRDVVLSGRYTYRRFVEQVCVAARGSRKEAPRRRASLRWAAAALLERASWLQVTYRLRGRRRLRQVARLPLRLASAAAVLVRPRRDPPPG
jgi:hypothetical protein